MVSGEKDWLSLTEASELLGVHPTTLRRWADAGRVPSFRTPGGHRRFQAPELEAWMAGRPLSPQGREPETMLHSAVGYARQEMALQRVSGELWYRAFPGEEERQVMRDMGRRLFGLAIQYMSRRRDHAPVLQEGQRIGDFFGQTCAQHGVGLADTVRALVFFRDSLLRATTSSHTLVASHDEEGQRLQSQLAFFLDAVMDACLTRYEADCRQEWATTSTT
jgi:excisionase family DNA binding protein